MQPEGSTWCLREKQLDWTSRLIQFSSGDHLSPAYLKMNPNGVVPTLLDGGDVVIDGTVINEYLEDVYPERPVRPKNPRSRRAARPAAITSTRCRRRRSGPVVQRLFRADLVANGRRTVLRLHRTATAAKTLLSPRWGAPASGRPISMKRWTSSTRRCSGWSRALADGPWLIGDQYTLADVSLHADHRADGRSSACRRCGAHCPASPTGMPGFRPVRTSASPTCRDRGI